PTPLITVVADDVAPPGRETAERLAGARVRVRWAPEAPVDGEATLVLADASRAPFATSRPAPGTPPSAEFVDEPRAAFAGVLVVRADGTSTTALVPIPPR
ncbi:hypothetical protein, partial [Roseisolibacter sp. H3M3-2]|uniref:hypothetical protein n=1 Tax=Roseisolibacter sp. H3M3-2 TaxID=3031323 RepID=UPI0023DCCE1C